LQSDLGIEEKRAIPLTRARREYEKKRPTEGTRGTIEGIAIFSLLPSPSSSSLVN
jgi:hypothetical protein